MKALEKRTGSAFCLEILREVRAPGALATQNTNQRAQTRYSWKLWQTPPDEAGHAQKCLISLEIVEFGAGGGTRPSLPRLLGQNR